MTEDPEKTSVSPLTMAFIALTTLMGMQMIRALIPYFLNVLRDRLDIDTTAAAGVALLIFSSAFLAGPVNRFFGSVPALIISAIVVGFTRLALQLWNYDPLGDMILAATGVFAFLVVLPVALGIARRTGGQAVPLMGAGLLTGFALDVAINGAFFSYDLAWQSGWLPAILVILTVAGQWWLIGQMVRTGFEAETADAPAAISLSWFFIGPFIFLELLIFANFGWAITETGLGFSLVYALLLLGQLVGLLLILLRRTPFRLVVLFLTGLAVLLILGRQLTGLSSAWSAAALLLSGQIALSGLVLAAMIRLGSGEQRNGLRNLTIIHGFSFVFLVILLFGYYGGYDLNLPFDNSLFPVLAFALVFLCGFPGLFQHARETADLPQSIQRAVLLLLILMLLPLGQWLFQREPEPATAGGGPVRLMVYNIHGGADPQGHIGLEAIAQIIERENPDVVGLQEVSRGWVLNGSMDSLTWLSRRLDMVPYFGPAADKQWGNAVLTRLPVSHFENKPLPPDTLLLKRAFMRLELDAGTAVPLTLINTHYHNPAEGGAIREEQSAVILDDWAGQPQTAVMGDFNAEHGMAEVDVYTAAGFGDVLHLTGVEPGYTNPVPGPFRRIDYIFITPDLTASDGVVPQDEASDHLPVAATIAVND